MTLITDAYAVAEDYLPLLKAFLGGGSDRTYLLAAQNSTEIRASGGFPGSIGTITIVDGVLTIGDFNSVYDVLPYGTPASVGPSELHYLETGCIIQEMQVLILILRELHRFGLKHTVIRVIQLLMV